MNGWAEHHGRSGRDGQAHAGRHRLGGTESWTPPVPPRQARPAGHSQHAHGELFAPPSTGSLPLPPQRRDRPSGPGYAPASGHLTLPPATTTDPLRLPPSVHKPSAEPPPLAEVAFTEPRTESPAEPPRDKAARRTKVTLTAPTPRRPKRVEPDEEVRVYLAPPVDGLGTFDLGSVPASVTPPKTWRKAAWFAAAASALVVVGLLFAGSYLVGKPAEQQQSQGGWPGYRGGNPLTDLSGTPETPPQGGAAGKPSGSEDEQEPSSRDDRSSSNPGTGIGSDGSAPPGPAPGPDGPATTGPPVPSKERPQKPPVVPAARTTTPAPWYAAQPDAKAMGDNTELFLNAVTTDPHEASTVTSGGLREQGVQGLRERYADVAYFEVKRVSIDQRRGVTVSTVEVTHKDGTKTIEQRTLTFGDDEKIIDDGM